MITIAVILMVLAVLYSAFVYSNIPFIKKWRTIYIETAMSTMTHQWLATKFIPSDVINDVVADMEAKLQDNQVDRSEAPPNKPTATPVAPTAEPTVEPTAEPTPEPTPSPEEIFFLMFPDIDRETVPDDFDYEAEEMSDIEDMGILTQQGDAVWAFDRVNGILIVTVAGEGYKGKLALISDSAQVKLVPAVNAPYRGDTTKEFCESYGALIAINGSGFADPEGMGYGAYPIGFAVYDGVIASASEGGMNQMCGYDYDDNFIIGTNLDPSTFRDAVEFYPNIILSGKKTVTGSFGMGLQPRTEIGQTDDGKTLLLIVDGRQPGHSIGITVDTCADILLKYHCYNAINLDGGSSSTMAYRGELITKSSSPMTYGRYLPNAWVVMPKES